MKLRSSRVSNSRALVPLRFVQIADTAKFHAQDLAFRSYYAAGHAWGAVESHWLYQGAAEFAQNNVLWGHQWYTIAELTKSVVLSGVDHHLEQKQEETKQLHESDMVDSNEIRGPPANSNIPRGSPINTNTKESHDSESPGEKIFGTDGDYVRYGNLSDNEGPLEKHGDVDEAHDDPLSSTMSSSTLEDCDEDFDSMG